MAQRRFWIWSFHSHTVTLCHTAILCHTLPSLDCHIVPCSPELNLCLRRKSHFQENGHHYFLRSISNLLNKNNRFSTVGEVRGISMKIGIGEIFINKNNYYTSFCTKLHTLVEKLIWKKLVWHILKSKCDFELHYSYYCLLTSFLRVENFLKIVIVCSVCTSKIFKMNCRKLFSLEQS